MFIYICQAPLCFQFTKESSNGNLEKVYLVICGCLVLVCGRLLVVCVPLLVVCGRLWWFVVASCFSNYAWWKHTWKTKKTYAIFTLRWNPPWRGEGAYLTKRFHPVCQQEKLVGEMQLPSIRTSRSFLC